MYRYYVTAPASPDGTGRTDPILRLSAPRVEAFIAATLARYMGLPELPADQLGDLVARVEARTTTTHLILRLGALFPEQPVEVAVATLRARIADGEIVGLDDRREGQVHVVLPRSLRLRGARARAIGGALDDQPKVDPKLVNALKRAHRDLSDASASPLCAPSELHGAQAPATHYERKLCRLAFLSPAIQRRILSGRQPAGITLQALVNGEIPLAWTDQSGWLDSLAR